MTFKTPYNAEPDFGRINTEPSQTIPDQSMTISEIMTRYSQGLGYTGPRVPSYDGGEDPFKGINIESLDLSEKHDLINRVNEHINDLQTSMRSQMEAKKQKLNQKPAEEKADEKRPNEAVIDGAESPSN